jgi:hypothetical protein
VVRTRCRHDEIELLVVVGANACKAQLRSRARTGAEPAEVPDCGLVIRAILAARLKVKAHALLAAVPR